MALYYYLIHECQNECSADPFCTSSGKVRSLIPNQDFLNSITSHLLFRLCSGLISETLVAACWEAPSLGCHQAPVHAWDLFTPLVLSCDLLDLPVLTSPPCLTHRWLPPPYCLFASSILPYSPVSKFPAAISSATIEQHQSLMFWCPLLQPLARSLPACNPSCHPCLGPLSPKCMPPAPLVCNYTHGRHRAALDPCSFEKNTKPKFCDLSEYPISFPSTAHFQAWPASLLSKHWLRYLLMVCFLPLT